MSVIGIDKFKAMLDSAFAMAKFINDHYDDLKALGIDIEQAADMLKKIMTYCQQQKRVVGNAQTQRNQ